MPKKLSSIALLQLGLVAAMGAYAHSGDEPPKYVAPDGVDKGLCQNPGSPCGTIGYAMGLVGKGGQVRVADGRYRVDDAADLFDLISGTIDVKGGFNAEDQFRSRSGNTSALIGVGAGHRELLNSLGFHVIADRKGSNDDVARRADRMLAAYATLKFSLPAVQCSNGIAGTFPCSNVDLLSHVGAADISANPGDAADVWGFVDLNTSREYAIAGFDIGTAVFDVTNAENPREVGFIDGQATVWRDIKVYQFWNNVQGRWNARAYITTDGASDGLFIVDLSELPHRVSRLNIPSPEFSQAHNIFVTSTDYGTGLALRGRNPTLIIAGSNSNNRGGRFLAFDTIDPSNPRLVAVAPLVPGTPSGYMHDGASMIITDSRIAQCSGAINYCEVLFDFNETTTDIWNISNPAAPELLSSTPSPIPVPDPNNLQTYIHSGWPSEDGQFLFVQDELDEFRNQRNNTTLRIYSLSDLTAPALLPEWTGPTAAIDHNGFVRGNRYYMSNYRRGLTVLDITDPASPSETGFFDTFASSDSVGFAGAWGAYPFFHSGNIAVSDINTGFYMVADRTLDVPQGSFAFSASSFGADEGGIAQLTVNRVGGSTGTVSVGYEIVPASGDAADLTFDNPVISWAAGDSADKTIDLTLVADADTDLERVLVRLVAPSGGATLAAGANTASLYISTPAAPSVAEFSDGTIRVPERGFGTAVAVLRRTGSAVGAVSVDYALTDGDAIAGVDYQGNTSGTIVWADGDADPKWVEFPIIDDGTGENDEFFELTLGNASGAGIGAQATLRIDVLDGSGTNTAPNAVAGISQTVNSGALVTLDGGGSNDPDGDALTYQWAQVSGSAVTLNNATSAMATFTAPTVSSDTLLQFSLTVADGKGQSDVASTSVTVRRVADNNNNNGGGGGSFGWLLLAGLIGARLMRKDAA